MKIGEDFSDNTLHLILFKTIFFRILKCTYNLCNLEKKWQNKIPGLLV